MSSAKSAIMATLVLGIFSAHADAVLPTDQNFKYRVREVPTDPQSRVVWEVILHLSAYSSSGNSVKWNVDGSEFIQYDSQGSVIAEWVERSPAPDTLDGLWLIEHADPEKPQSSEFDFPPLITGMAVARNPSDDDLDYSFEGAPYLAPPGEPPFEDPAAANFRFRLLPLPDPEEEGEDEIVEIQPIVDPG